MLNLSDEPAIARDLFARLEITAGYIVLAECDIRCEDDDRFVLHFFNENCDPSPSLKAALDLALTGADASDIKSGALEALNAAQRSANFSRGVARARSGLFR